MAKRDDSGRYVPEARPRGKHGQFIPRGTKQCIDCLGIFPATHENFCVKKKHPDGSVKWWQSYCKDCQKARFRVYQGIKNRGRPYEKRAPALTPEQLIERRRARVAKRMEDPEYRERVRERSRRAARERRRAQQDFVIFYHVDSPDAWHEETNPDELLSPEPFADYVKREFASVEEAALAMSVNPRTLRALDAGERVHVSLAWVDRALVLAGRTSDLNNIYPVTV